MKLRRTAVAVLATLILAVPTLPLAADKFDIGKREYDGSCAVCHGANGKGKTSFAELLQVGLPDLTTLSRNNGGVFPITYVYNVIDGREALKAHGTRDMPIWGRQFPLRAAPEFDEYAYEPELYARGRILAVIDYLYRLQAK
jgi:mono/diheme cytochrome c family protein